MARVTARHAALAVVVVAVGVGLLFAAQPASGPAPDPGPRTSPASAVTISSVDVKSAFDRMMGSMEKGALKGVVHSALIIPDWSGIVAYTAQDVGEAERVVDAVLGTELASIVRVEAGPPPEAQA